MHPAFYFSLVVIGPAVVVGGLMAWDALRDAPVAYEDATGFWQVDRLRTEGLSSIEATAVPQTDGESI